MGFLFGIVNLKNDAVKSEDIRILCDAVKWDGFDDKIVVHDSFAVGYCWNKNRTPNAGIYTGENFMLICDARIYNGEELHKEIGFNTPEEAFAKGYAKWGMDFANKFNGDFSVVIIDFSQQKVLLVRDHIGARPLCYSIKNDQLLFASHEFGIARSNLIDITLSEEYLIQAFHPNNKQNYCLTVFKQINKVTPGHSLSITCNKQENRKYWYPERIRKNKKLSFECSVTNLRYYLVKATKTRIGNGMQGAHVSGGLDSSGIAAIVADNIEDKSRLIGYSWSPEENIGDVEGLNEKELIEDFSKQKGVNVNYLTNSESTLIDDYILPEFEQMPIEIFTMRKARKDGVTSIFSGWGGDEFVSLALRGSINHIVFHFKLWTLIRWIKHFGIKATIARAKGEILPLLVPFGLFESGTFKRYGLNYFKNSFIVKHWKLFFFNRKKNIYGWGDRNGLMIKLLYNYHLPQRMDSWALFGEKYGIEYKFPLLDKELLGFWFTIPIKYTYEGMSHRYLYRESMKGILNEPIRMRTDKNEAVFQKKINLRNQKIKEKLVSRPDLFSESPHLNFFKTREFQKLATDQPVMQKIFNLQMHDMRFFLRYRCLVNKYLSQNYCFTNTRKE